MGNKSIHIDKVEMAKLMMKMKALGATAEMFDQEIKAAAERIKDKARNDFRSGAEPYLRDRGEDTSGLASSIKVKTLKRGKGVGSAYEVTAGGAGQKIMAYAEFGTRSETIDLSGIRSVFGSVGDAYAATFKGGNQERFFTHLVAKPYFYKNVHKEYSTLFKTLSTNIKKALKK
jgi:hypothetical protein